jgi:hypothetical protein
MPSRAFLVLVSKYCDHTPLYRQSQIFARLGVDLDRSTLAGWVGGACWWLDALHERLCSNVFASDHLFADDTPVPVLDPGRGRTKTGRLWVYARDQRSWGGPAAPAAIFVFAPDRKSERPASHLKNFSGILHVDGYAGFVRLRARGDVWDRDRAAERGLLHSFTHMHNDHTDGFADLAQSRWAFHGTGPKIGAICSADVASPQGVVLTAESS